MAKTRADRVASSRPRLPRQGAGQVGAVEGALAGEELRPQELSILVYSLGVLRADVRPGDGGAGASSGDAADADAAAGAAGV